MMLNKIKKNEGKRNVKKVKVAENDAETKAVSEKQDKVEKVPSVTKVGTLLKNMRLEKGLKVIDVAKRLCIRKQYLDAIEDSNYGEVPAFPYGVGFVRSYADFLGLNSSNIVELYKEETTMKREPDVAINEPQKKSAMPEVVYVLIGLIAIAVLYGVWTMLNDNNQSADEIAVSEDIRENQVGDLNDVVVVEELTMAQEGEDATDNVVSSSDNNQVSIVETSYTEPAQESKPADTSSVAPEQSTTESQKPEAQNVIPTKGVYVEILGETWIEVKNEEKLYLSKVLKVGENYTLPNDKGLMLSIGKKGSVNVYVNGVKTDIARSGKQMHIDIDSYINGNH